MDFNDGVKRELKEKRFRYAFTALPGKATPETERFSLPRLVIEPRHSLKEITGLIRLIRLGFFHPKGTGSKILPVPFGGSG